MTTESPSLLSRAGYHASSIYLNNALKKLNVAQKVQDGRAELAKVSGSPIPAIACEMITQFAQDFIKHMVLHPTAPLSVGSPPKEKWVNLMRNGKQKTYRAEFFEQMITKKESTFKAIIEGILLTGTTNFVKHLSQVQEKNPLLLENIVSDVTAATAEHIKRINIITLKGTRSVSHRTMLKKFDRAEQLHPAVAPNPPLCIEQAKDSRKPMIKQLSERLLMILFPHEPGTTPDLGIPNISISLFDKLQDWIWDSIREDWFPEIVSSMYDLILEPHTINTMSLSLVEPILNSSSRPIRALVVPNDDLQNRLNKACSDLVDQLTNLFPHTFVNTVFHLPLLRINVGRALGSIIRKKLTDTRVVELFVNSLRSGLPSWHNGSEDWRQSVWAKNNVDQDILVHQKLDPSSPSRTVPVQKLEFVFQKTKEDLWKKAEKQNVEKDKLEEKLIEEFYHVFTSTFYNAFPKYILDTLSSLNVKIDNATDRWLGEMGLMAKEFIHNMVHKIFIIWIGSAVYKAASFVLWPAVKVFKTHIMNQSKKIVHILHMSIHENLVYKISDILERSVLVKQG